MTNKGNWLPSHELMLKIYEELTYNHPQGATVYVLCRKLEYSHSRIRNVLAIMVERHPELVTFTEDVHVGGMTRRTYHAKG